MVFAITSMIIHDSQQEIFRDQFIFRFNVYLDHHIAKSHKPVSKNVDTSEWYFLTFW